MHHLSLESLARLVDEPAAPEEALHIRDCIACRRELAELRRQTEALATLGRLEPPAEEWIGVRARLLDEGLVRAEVPTHLRLFRHPGARAAAAVAVLLLGAFAAARSWSATRMEGGTPTASSAERQTELAAAVAWPGSRASEPDPRPQGRTLESATEQTATNHPRLRQPGSEGALRFVSATARTGDEAPRRNPRGAREGAAAEDAARELRETEQAYLAALQRYAALADPASGADPVARLTALEGLISTTREALERAPASPVINGYHLAAVGERDAMLTRIASTSETTWF